VKRRISVDFGNGILASLVLGNARNLGKFTKDLHTLLPFLNKKTLLKNRKSFQLAIKQTIHEHINRHSFLAKLKSVKPKQRKKKRVNFLQEVDPFLFKKLLKNT
jgi:hypothetical protein